MRKKVANSQESKVIVLRCYGHPGTKEGVEGHYAVCIDLNLVTWRESPQEAQKSLMDAVHGYLQTAAEVAESPKEFENLLSRRAPFFPYRLTYHSIALLAALSSNNRSKNRPSVYDSPVEVPAFV